MLGLDDARLIELPARRDERGALVAVDAHAIPFAPVRGFYVYGIPAGEERGGHAHRVTEQVVVAMNGAFSIELDDGARKRAFRLDARDRALYIPPLIWDRLYDFSPDAVCFVFASTTYQPADYIRDRAEFLRARGASSPSR